MVYATMEKLEECVERLEEAVKRLIKENKK